MARTIGDISQLTASSIPVHNAYVSVVVVVDAVVVVVVVGGEGVKILDIIHIKNSMNPITIGIVQEFTI
jgi:hypothetical protein